MIQLTQEEIDELKKLEEEWKRESRRNKYSSTSYSNYGHNYDDFGYGYGDTRGHDKSPKTKHQWKSTLLILSTVYTCELCGAKKEKAKGANCEDET